MLRCPAGSPWIKNNQPALLAPAEAHSKSDTLPIHPRLTILRATSLRPPTLSADSTCKAHMRFNPSLYFSYSFVCRVIPTLQQ